MQDAICRCEITTTTTTRSCPDPETAVSNFWSPGVRDRPQRVPSAGSGGRRLLLLPPPPSVQLPSPRHRAAACDSSFAAAVAVCRHGGSF